MAGLTARGFRRHDPGMTETERHLLPALLHGPGFGLELVERVKRLTGGVCLLGAGSLYGALRDLEARGLVISRDSPGPAVRGVGRPRRHYELTPVGRAAAVEVLAAAQAPAALSIAPA